jgi:enoyl-[acyl-carrier protein] reductase III
MRFAGQVALVTGGSRGIGRAAALALAEGGADVAINYRANEEAAREVAQAIRSRGRRALPLRADLGDSEQIRKMFEIVRGEFGFLDILVANAAATAFKPVLAQREHNLTKTFAITVNGFVLCAQEAAQLMAGRRGRIVAVSGIDSVTVLRDHGALGPAKAAMEVLVRYLAVELGPLGITVNAVNPGLVETDSGRRYLGADYLAVRDRVAAATPVGRRVGHPEDIAKVIAFFCSDDAAWVTGQTLVADGGFTLDSPLFR